MKALDVLVEEHRLIEQVLDSLEISTGLLERGVAVKPEFFLSAADFMRNYADGCHHAKEEGILFPRMEQQGIPTDGCPLGVMLAEHACGRQYTRALVSAAQAIQTGNPDGIQRAIQSSRSYITLLRSHINKEDNRLFPIAEAMLPPDQHEPLLEAFERVEREEIGIGVHEKYTDLAHRLKTEIVVYM